MELVPTGRDEVLMVATPRLSVAEPRNTPPLVNVTVSPFGGGPITEVTVAVSVTDAPQVEELTVELTVVVVVPSMGFVGNVAAMAGAALAPASRPGALTSNETNPTWLAGEPLCKAKLSAG